MSAPGAVLWHDVECGGYEADLPLWEQLADSRPGPILDLGCGSGRVALHLARRGHRVVGLDVDAELVQALRERAAELPVQATLGDARDFSLGAAFSLVIAPMQLLQLLRGREERIRCLRSVADHLEPGGLAAIAIVESVPIDDEVPPPLPDARESGGWVYSSLPLTIDVEADAIRIRRLRQAVSPNGDLSDETDETTLARLDADTLEAEAAAARLRACGRRHVPMTDRHVGSSVVLLGRAG